MAKKHLYTSARKEDIFSIGIVYDNSYATELTTGMDMDLKGAPLTIASHPFELKVKRSRSHYAKLHPMEFVLVMHGDNVFFVLNRFEQIFKPV